MLYAHGNWPVHLLLALSHQTVHMTSMQISFRLTDRWIGIAILLARFSFNHYPQFSTLTYPNNPRRHRRRGPIPKWRCRRTPDRRTRWRTWEHKPNLNCRTPQQWCSTGRQPSEQHWWGVTTNLLNRSTISSRWNWIISVYDTTVK